MLRIATLMLCASAAAAFAVNETQAHQIAFAKVQHHAPSAKKLLDSMSVDQVAKQYSRVLTGLSTIKANMQTKLAPYRMKFARVHALLTRNHDMRRRLDALEDYGSNLANIGEALENDEVADLNDLFGRFQGASCSGTSGKSEIVLALTSELSNLIEDMPQQSIGDLLNSLFGCICSASLNFDTAEYRTAWNAGKQLITGEQSDPDIVAFIVAFKAILPQFLGGGGLCAGDCQLVFSSLVDFGLTAATELASFTLPAATANLRTSITGCLCSNHISWSAVLDPLLPVNSELSTVKAVQEILDSGLDATYNGENALYLVLGRFAAQIDATFSPAQICGGGCPVLFDDITETLIFSATRVAWPTGPLPDLLGNSLKQTAQESDLPTEADLLSYSAMLRGELCAMNFGGLVTSFRPYILNGFDTSPASRAIETFHNALGIVVRFECDAGGQINPETFKLFSGMLVRALTTTWRSDDAVQYASGQWSEEGFLPVTPGLVTKSDLDGLVQDYFGCVCHYFRTDTTVLPFVTGRITYYESGNEPSDWGDAIVTDARQAIRISSSCGSVDCRGTFTKLHALISKMSTHLQTAVVINNAPACSASTGAECFGDRVTFAPSSFSGTCAAVPVTNPNSQPSLPYPMAHIDDDAAVRFIFWATCWMSTDCPPDGVAALTVTQEVTISETVDSFTEAKQTLFKANYVRMLGIPGITTSNVELRVNSGSLVVTVVITTASTTARAAASSRLDTLTPASMSSALGVTVTQASTPIDGDLIISPPPPPTASSPGVGDSKKDDGLSTGAIIAIAVGVVALVIAIAIACVCYFKGQADATKANAGGPKMTGTMEMQEKGGV